MNNSCFKGSIDSNATVQSPVRLILTTADENFVALLVSAAVPNPCELDPIERPTAISSLTPNLVNIVSPNDAPNIPVSTTKSTANDGSAPRIDAPAKANGDVIHRVKVAKATLGGTKLKSLAIKAELNNPINADVPVESSMRILLDNSMDRY